MMGRYSEEPHFAFYRDENIRSMQQGQKLDPRCEINKHIFVFTYQLYKFMLVVYIDMHYFSNNRAFVAK
jgi:hypothetical protein